jgi:acetyl esterase/lipase
MPTSTPKAGQWTTKIAYSDDNFLQTYDVFLSTTVAPSSKILWIVYIHGGFFRDSLVDSESFQMAVSLLGKTPPSSTLNYASINYRLSPSTKHPQDSSTPSFEQRTAKWPQHLEDVCEAIQQLQSRHSFGANYVLAGHSVGATLAMLAALKSKDNGFVAPTAVLGLSGIYDFGQLHKDHPEYEALTFNALQRGEEVYASPTNYEAEAYKTAGVTRVLLAHSHDDGLVPFNQVDRMVEVLASGGGGYAQTIELFGKHNDIWANGVELERAIRNIVESLAV